MREARAKPLVARGPGPVVGGRARISLLGQQRVPTFAEIPVLRLAFVKRLPPAWVVRHVVVGRDEAPRDGRMHVSSAVLAREAERGSVLAGDRDHFRLAVGVDELV